MKYPHAPGDVILIQFARARTDWHFTSRKDNVFPLFRFCHTGVTGVAYWFTFQALTFLSDLEEKKKNKEWQLAPEQHEVRNRRWDFEIETHSCSPYAERHQGGILFLKGEHFNVEVESLTMLSVCSVCKKELLKNNIPFKRCSTLKLSMVKVETPWVTEVQPCRLLPWKYRTIRLIVGGWRMGRSGNMLMFTE